MDVDAKFPSLSSFVQRKRKRTLNEYGKDGELKNDDYWSLKSSCWAVLSDQRKWRDGPHQTLNTLDEYIRCLPPTTPVHEIITGICAEKKSEFLDTVVEATWALQFWANGVNVNLKQPFGPKNRKGETRKNADFVVTLDGIKYWLDATSIELNESDFPVPTRDNPCVRRRPAKDLIAKLIDKARDTRQFISKQTVLRGVSCGVRLEKGTNQHRVSLQELQVADHFVFHIIRSGN